MNTKKVLIVDDDEEVAYLLSVFMEKIEFEFEVKNDGVSARKWLAENKPDLILLDVMLPDITGIEFCKWITSLENLKDVPIIHMTAFMADEIAREDSMLAGAKDFITKPIDFDELLAYSQPEIALKVSDSKIAIGTAQNGVLIMNLQGQLLQVINKASGLQDDTIFDMQLDHDGGLWVVMNNGISRIEINIVFELSINIDIPFGICINP